MSFVKRRALYLILTVAVACAVASLVLLIDRQAGGPPHRNVSIGRETPATLYTPVTPAAFTTQSEEQPVIVLGHGYSADRVGMSSLARSLASFGYAVLAIDFPGHGANRTGFRPVAPIKQVEAAFNWLQQSSRFHSSPVIAMGHSMGAHAALSFSTEDPRPSAVIAVGSSLVELEGPLRPSNVALIVAERDPTSVHAASSELATRLAGTEVELNRTYGDVEDGTAVQLLEIPGADHITVLWSDKTVAAAVSWLDQVFGVRRGTVAHLVDPRLQPAFVYLVCALVLLVGIGLLSGRLTPDTKGSNRSSLSDLLVVGAALAVAMLFTAVIPSVSLFLYGFDEVVLYLAIAGGLLMVVRFARGTGGLHWTMPTSWIAAQSVIRIRGQSVATAGLVAVSTTFLLFSPLGLIFHRLVPTPERGLAGFAVFLLVLPCFCSLQTILRRGRPVRAAAVSLMGHAGLIGALYTGVKVGVLPSVVALGLPFLLVVFLLVEVFALSAYSASRSSLLIGVVETSFVTGLAATVMPIR